MFVTNRAWFGHIVDTDNFDSSHLNNELFEIFNNPYNWENRYIHPHYSHSLEEDSVIEQVGYVLFI